MKTILPILGILLFNVVLNGQDLIAKTGENANNEFLKTFETDLLTSIDANQLETYFSNATLELTIHTEDGNSCIVKNDLFHYARSSQSNSNLIMETVAKYGCKKPREFGDYEQGTIGVYTSNSEEETKSDMLRKTAYFSQIVQRRPLARNCLEQKLSSEDLILCSNRELQEYLFEKIKDPRRRRRKLEQPIVSFVVSKSGSVQDVNVLRTKSALIKEELLRVFRSLDNNESFFSPGIQFGNYVRVQYNLPINFKK